MRSCLLLSLALAGLSAFANPSAAADKPRDADVSFAPAALIRVPSLDALTRG